MGEEGDFAKRIMKHFFPQATGFDVYFSCQ